MSNSTTRKRTSPQNSSPTINGAYSPKSNSPSSISETSQHLPPERKGRPMRKVSPPGSKTRLSTFLYVLVLLTALLGTFYAYRITQYKTSVGGWWGMLMGRKPVVQGGQYGYGGSPDSKRADSEEHENTVESHIEALAKALGMPTPELASAIAGAVRAYVPPASLSSIKAAEPTGEAVRVMLEEKEGEKTSEEGHHGVMEGMASGIESFVGMDEP